VSPGDEQSRIRINVKADCPDKDLKELLAYAQQHSPACITVCRPVPVLIERVMSDVARLAQPYVYLDEPEKAFSRNVSLGRKRGPATASGLSPRVPEATRQRLGKSHLPVGGAAPRWAHVHATMTIQNPAVRFCGDEFHGA
jgi:hypothetical protein